jgi:hypothetical protein
MLTGFSQRFMDALHNVLIDVGRLVSCFRHCLKLVKAASMSSVNDGGQMVTSTELDGFDRRGNTGQKPVSTTMTCRHRRRTGFFWG